LRKLVLISSFSALAVALGLTFLAIPNFELVTITFFLAGYFLGARDGVISAILGEFVYSLLNPLGTAAPPLLIAQILGMAIIAFCGSLAARKSLKLSENPKTNFQLTKAFYFGAFGLILTLLFDLLTTVSFLLFSGLSFTKFIASLIYGMYFYLVHIGMNTLIFAILLPIIVPIIKNKLPGFENR
jgi:hypothetical protein